MGFLVICSRFSSRLSSNRRQLGPSHRHRGQGQAAMTLTCIGITQVSQSQSQAAPDFNLHWGPSQKAPEETHPGGRLQIMSEHDLSGSTSSIPKGRSQDASGPAGVNSTPRIRPCAAACTMWSGRIIVSQSEDESHQQTGQEQSTFNYIRKAHKPTQGTFLGHLA